MLTSEQIDSARQYIIAATPCSVHDVVSHLANKFNLFGQINGATVEAENFGENITLSDRSFRYSEPVVNVEE